MDKPTTLRAQAPEFQPQKKELKTSASNAAVPASISTAELDTGAGAPSTQETADDNRDSFSTVSQATSTENDIHTPEQPTSPEVIVKVEMTNAALDNALAQNVNQLVDGDEIPPPKAATAKEEHPRTSYSHTAGYIRRAPAHQQQPIPIPGPAMYSPSYNWSYMQPNTTPYMIQPQSYYAAPSFTTASSIEPALVNLQGQTILSAGSDPISEGRRIYIGNIKYSVNRTQIKKLLREFGVNDTIEKIYMPYNDTPFESSAGADGEHGDSDSTNNAPAAATFPSNAPLDNHNSGDPQYDGRDGDLPNKGYVFVTYSNPAEAEVAIKRLSGVMHLDRRLVCRPGLPKGVAFRQTDKVSGPGRYRGRRDRREKNFRQDQFQSYREDQPATGRGGVGGYYNNPNDFAHDRGQHSAYGSQSNFAPRVPMDPGYAYGNGYSAGSVGGGASMGSGYRSAIPSSYKGPGSFGYGYSNDNYSHFNN